MEVVIAEESHEIGTLVAKTIVDAVVSSDAYILGLSTGSSPLPVYEKLIRAHRRGEVSFGSCRMFLLDEYVGLDSNDPRSYAAFIRKVFTDHIDVSPRSVMGPDGTAEDPQGEGRAYDRTIERAGGVDLQLLGIGSDGHLGFNEPGSSLASRTRIKTLTTRTRRDNARFFDHEDDVPHHVLTQGIGTILDARHLVLVAMGMGKASAVAAAVEGPVTASCPASALQLHPHVSVVIDEEAASQMTNVDYYRETYAAKPAWQRL